MDVARLLERMRQGPEYCGQLEHVEVLAAREARYGRPQEPMAASLSTALRALGMESLYLHQVAALDEARAANDWVVTTGTASGKTLCYHLPVMDQLLASASSRALYLFPTKALAQDQLKGTFEFLAPEATLAKSIRPGVYDGDTPTAQRRRIRNEANLVLSNPDMLHAAILPYHPKWADFFHGLRYVVLDEVHTYRGILGAHVSAVLRRLDRICRHYGSQPTFLATSATIANPGELVGRLIGRSVNVIEDDGSPRGRKYFALWNPMPLGADNLARRSANDDAVSWLTEAVVGGGQALAFARTRQATELVFRYSKDRLGEARSDLSDCVRAYRGGYLPNERREIEQQLFTGQLRGVVATNALELGIDVGSLDVSILINYPGTIASCWQQAGRSGRRQDESLAVLLAGNDPVDQYLLRHPEYFFAQSPEHAVVDPDNPFVLAKHLQAAAFELPLADDDLDRFGPLAAPIAGVLCDEQRLIDVGGTYYFPGGQNPAVGVSLRHMSDNTFSIVLREDARSHRDVYNSGGRVAVEQQHQVIANVDSISAPELVYPEAVYLHHAETFLVRELDLQAKIAYVERRETDYYTQAVLESSVKITGERRQSSQLAGVHLAFGDVDVSWKTVAFKKIRFETRENIGMGPVDIPEQTLSTTALWLAPDETLQREMRAQGLRASEGLVGLRNLAVVALPMVSMCDSRDLGGVVESKNLGRSTIFLYDRYPGGLGYSERGFQHFDRLLTICHEMVSDCPCGDGCPSCVGLPNLRPAIHSDPDLTRGHPMPNKQATIALAELLLATISPTSPPVGQA